MVLEPLVFMGGTFDPIHVGHLRMAIELAEALEVSGLTLLPAADPPLRETPRVPAEQACAYGGVGNRSDSFVAVRSQGAWSIGAFV
jgi:hypothetical protein